VDAKSAECRQVIERCACACGRWKKAGAVFCWDCWQAIPPSMRAKLIETRNDCEGKAFAKAFASAKVFIEAEKGMHEK